MNTVVYRGVPCKNFYNNLKQLREWHDGEVILSTWHDVEVDESMIDEVVRSEDPGEDTDIANPSLRFAKRQIVAANNGVLKAKGEKVLLTRTDILHKHNLFDLVRADNSGSPYGIFLNRLVVGSVMSIDPDSNLDPENERLYRICDWFQWGHKEDLIKFTDVLEELPKYKQTGCCLEQIWFLSCYNKYCQNKLDVSNITNHKEKCWKIIIENFNIINSVGLNTGKWKNKIQEQIYISEQKYRKYYERLSIL